MVHGRPACYIESAVPLQVLRGACVHVRRNEVHLAACAVPKELVPPASFAKSFSHAQHEHKIKGPFTPNAPTFPLS